MGSFAGYSVSVSTFEIVRLFFNGIFQWLFLRLFWTAFSSDVAIWWIAFLDLFFPRPRTSYSSPCTYRSSFPLPQDFLDVIFLVATLSTVLDTRRLFFSMTNQKLFCFSRAWRRLVMSEEDSWCLKRPGEAFHTRRHRPRRRHQESRLVAPKTPIWLTHTHTLRLTD